MSKRSTTASRWSVADAKARLAELIEEARRRPQTIERRGQPVAVVLSIDTYEASDVVTRWRSFLDASAALRAEGGGELRLPRRTRRRSPFGR